MYRTSAETSSFRTQDDTEKANFRYTANKKYAFSHFIRNILFCKNLVLEDLEEVFGRAVKVVADDKNVGVRDSRDFVFFFDFFPHGIYVEKEINH